MAEARWLASGNWSRYVSRRLKAPSLERPKQFIEWLLDFGKREPGRVLYPTSDDVAFLYARHRDELARYFQLYQPPVESIYALLNKQRLTRAAAAVGLEMPPSWLPRDDADLAQIGASLSFPVLIKPQTQILYFPHPKGMLVTELKDLAAAYETFSKRARHADELLSFDPMAHRPLLQAFYPGARRGIYNLSGFVDESGELMIARASRKVLQRPRKLGIGVCFEWAPVRPELVERLAALCRNIGYYGVFEVEFIEQDERALLLDFNPRFYGEMGFDMARGVSLPLFAYLAAIGRREELRRAIEKARIQPDVPTQAYCHRFMLEVGLWAQQLSGTLSRSEVSQWRNWLSERRGNLVDAVHDPQDRFPGLVEVASHVYAYARHPRAFMHQVVLDR